MIFNPTKMILRFSHIRWIETMKNWIWD